MRSRTTAVLVVLGLSALAACGGDDPEATPTSDEAPDSAAATPTDATAATSDVTTNPPTTEETTTTAAPTTAAPTTTTTEPTTTTTEAPKVTHEYPYVEATTTFEEIANHPAFEGFGPYMDLQEAGSGVELTRGVPVEVIGQVRSNWDTQTMLDGLNFMIDQVNAGETIFHPPYTDDEIAADPTKGTAGMFFVAGDPGAPLAVIAPGGGLGAVVSIQEGFPHARALHELGFNVAILKYRIVPDIDLGDTAVFESALANAVDDLARALTLVEENADVWGADLDGYSLWGSSAGGGVVSAWGADGPLGAEAHGFDPPAAIVVAYPAPWFEPSADFPPYYVVMAEDDGTIPVARIDALVEELTALGTTVEYQRVAVAGHGFGLGIDTDAAGWLDLAVDFWTAQGDGSGDGSEDST